MNCGVKFEVPLSVDWIVVSEFKPLLLTHSPDRWVSASGPTTYHLVIPVQLRNNYDVYKNESTFESRISSSLRPGTQWTTNLNQLSKPESNRDMKDGDELTYV